MKTMNNYISSPISSRHFVTKFSIVFILLLQLLSSSTIAQQELLIIGDENLVEGKENAEEYLIGTIRWVTVDNEGNVYIVDTQKRTIQKFSPDGVFLTKIGRRGKGPGEYTLFPGRLVTDRFNNLYMKDVRSKIIKYDLNGNFLCNHILSQFEEIKYLNIKHFEVLEEDHFLFHGSKNGDPKFQYIFWDVDFVNKVVTPFGNYPEIKRDKQTAKLADYESANFDFIKGNMVVDHESRLIHYVKELHPKELLLYSLGKNEPETLSVDNTLSGGFNITEMKKRIRNGYARPVPNQSVEFTDSYIIDKTLYRQIRDNKTGELFIRGYSLKDGEIVFNEKIESEVPNPFDVTSMQLSFIDSNLNAYIIIREPYYHLLRVKLKNGGTISLPKN